MKKLIPGILIVLFVIVGGLIAIFYAYGYRFQFGGGTGNIKFLEGTGLLVATSKPDGARVLVNDHLTTATNNTINLAPGNYDVKIQKDGYVTWEKKIIIKKALVSEANALLIAAAPDMLAALELYMAEHDASYDGWAISMELLTFLNAARAAIAKAIRALKCS